MNFGPLRGLRGCSIRALLVVVLRFFGALFSGFGGRFPPPSGGWTMGRVIVLISQEPFAEVGVPVILYLVIGSAREPTGNERPAVAEKGVQSDDQIVLVRSYVAPLDVGPEIIHPSKSAALSAPQKPSFLREGSPMAFAMCLNIVNKQ